MGEPDRIELSATDTLGTFIQSIRESSRLAHERPAYAEANGERG
jgi:hypothetical protein